MVSAFIYKSFILYFIQAKVKSLSCAQLLATPWIAAYQAPLSMGFSRQEYWSGLPLPSPNSILTPPYFSPFLEKGIPKPVQEILASNRGCSSLGEHDHWMDHKSHIPGQQDLHSLFSFPCLYSNDLEVASPERQWGFTKPLDYFANNKFSYRRYTALEGL